MIPYVAPDGKVWFVGQAGNYIAYLDPKSGSRSASRSKQAPTRTR